MACRAKVAPQQSARAWWAYRGIERPNATRRATHLGMPAQKRREPAINRLRFTDTISVITDFALRQLAGQHDGLVVAVVLACLRSINLCLADVGKLTFCSQHILEVGQFYNFKQYRGRNAIFWARKIL